MDERIKKHEPFGGVWYLKSEKPLGKGGFGAVYDGAYFYQKME